MKSINCITNTGNSKIFLDAGFDELKRLCDPETTVVIVDRTVHDLYREKLLPYRCFAIDPGEECKTLRTIDAIYERCLEWELDRSSTVVGVGGGMVCDIAGFVASTYLRGIRFGFVPTTLLAMVDAGVGGKNGVNYKGYKNLVGTFNQPDFVLCDYTFLRTLPYDELKNGIAEAIKSGLIGDKALFDYIESNGKKITLLDNDAIRKVILDSLNVKIDFVSRDEKEKGERRKLNFGHTIGHAIEKSRKLHHGEAVSIGMAVAARLSGKRGALTENETGRIERLLSNFQLPITCEGERKEIMEAVLKDKKREGEDINFVLLDGIGNSRVEKVKIKDIQEVFCDLC